jgi:hypothetical protein
MALNLPRFPDTLEFSEAIDEDWEMHYRLGPAIDGTLVISHLIIAARHRHYGPATDDIATLLRNRRRAVPGGGITTAVLRGIKLGVPTRYARALIKTQDPDRAAVSASPGKKAKGAARRGRPRTRTDAFFRQLLEEKLALERAKVPNVAKEIACKHGFNRSTVRAWLSRASERLESSPRLTGKLTNSPGANRIRQHQPRAQKQKSRTKRH